MMAGSSSSPAPVSPQFCVGYPVDLIIPRVFAGKTIGVTDVNGNLVFTFKSKAGRCVLLDAAGNPLLTLRQKVLTAHKRWQAFRGESTDKKDLIFSVKESSFFQFNKTCKFDIFLSSNTNEDLCDFRIEGIWPVVSVVIYAGTTNNIIAHMHKKKKHGAKEKDTYGVTVYPNIDYAFIVALMVNFQENKVDISAYHTGPGGVG